MAASTTLWHIHPCVFRSVWMYITYSSLLLFHHFHCLQLSHCPRVSLCLCFIFFCIFVCLPVPFLSHRIPAFLLLSSRRFLPPVDCLPEQHVAGGVSKKQEWGGRKKHSSPELVCSCKKKNPKNINYLHDWMMLAQLLGCCLRWDEWRSSGRRRFLCRLVFLLRIQPHHQ